MLGGVLITAVVVGAPIIVLGAVRDLRLRHPGSSSVANLGQNSLVLPLTRFESTFIKNLLFFLRVVGVVTRLLVGQFAVRNSTGTGDFLFSVSFGPALWLIQPAIQWGSGLLLGKKAAGA